MLCCHCLPPGSLHVRHFGHFHRAISYLQWYKIVRIRYLACTFSQMKSINMFYMFFCNLEFPDISFGKLLRFEYITSLFSCLCMSMLTSNSSGNMQKHGFLGCFNATSARENISWVWVLCMEELVTTFSSWKRKLFAISIYKGDINLDIAQKEHEI